MARLPQTLKVAHPCRINKQHFFMMELDNAIVLKISSKDKAAIQQQANQERLSLSAYVRRSLCSNTGHYEDGE